MEFKIIVPTSLTKAVAKLNRTLERLTEDYEAYLRAAGVQVPLRHSLSAEEQRVEVSYVDEEKPVLDAIRREMGQTVDEESDV